MILQVMKCSRMRQWHRGLDHFAFPVKIPVRDALRNPERHIYSRRKRDTAADSLLPSGRGEFPVGPFQDWVYVPAPKSTIRRQRFCRETAYPSQTPRQKVYG